MEKANCKEPLLQEPRLQRRRERSNQKIIDSLDHHKKKPKKSKTPDKEVPQIQANTRLP